MPDLRFHGYAPVKHTDTATANLTESPDPMAADTSSPKPSVLVVDNDPLVLLGTVVMLRELGYPVTSTDAAEHSLAWFETEEAPAILVTDYAMPKMNGVELGQAVIRLKPSTQVLIVTGHDSIGDEIPCEWQCLSKPFSCAELRSALERLGSPKRTVGLN
jgi:CheY-like chemotaxis protein